ncbi:MAG: hypothetical protein ABW024_07095 [Microbacterium sp.]
MSSRARLAWIIGLAGAVAVIGVGTYVHVSANTSFDEVAAALDAANGDAAEVRDTLADAVDAGDGAVAAADAVIASAGDDLIDPAVRGTVADAVGAATAEIDAAEAALAMPLGEAEEKPGWTWELFSATERLDDGLEDTRQASTEMEDAVSGLSDADAALEASVIALSATVAPAAIALETANVSAASLVVLDFRDAAGVAGDVTSLGSGAAVAFEDYAQKASALKASNESELAEKAGPLRETRLEIEEYARSIAGGVVLDFDWAPIVAGTGGSEGIGGTATWNSARGGFSTITLSHSIAETWPDADARALVTHEVGHSITSKCWEMFDSQNQMANEEWATAWAISMGQTAQGNGTWAYGYPSQAMIDLAATCR